MKLTPLYNMGLETIDYSFLLLIVKHYLCTLLTRWGGGTQWRRCGGWRGGAGGAQDSTMMLLLSSSGYWMLPTLVTGSHETLCSVVCSFSCGHVALQQRATDWPQSRAGPRASIGGHTSHQPPASCLHQHQVDGESDRGVSTELPSTPHLLLCAAIYNPWHCLPSPRPLGCKSMTSAAASLDRPGLGCLAAAATTNQPPWNHLARLSQKLIRISLGTGTK